MVNKLIDPIVFIFFASTILFSPYYIFDSGMPQPAHFVMSICAILIMFLKKNKFIDLLKKQKASIFFILFICTINLFYGLHSHPLEFFINTVYWIYGFTILFAVMLIANDTKYYKIIKYLILVSFILIISLYFAGFGGFKFPPRYNGFFNGPNQIGYFVLLMTMVFFVTNVKKFDALFFYSYSCALFIIYLSGSRSVYLAAFSLILLLLLMPKIKFKDMFLLILLPVVVFFMTKIPTLENKSYHLVNGSGEHQANTIVAGKTIYRTLQIINSEEYNDSEIYSIKYQLIARGYDRFHKFPQFLIFGSGQGNDNRFVTELIKERTTWAGTSGKFANYEMHSSFFGVLFYYGLIGLILFLKSLDSLFIYRKNIVFLLPIFVYGLFTYGLRSPYFWFTLGFLVVMSDIFHNYKINWLTIKKIKKNES